MKNNTKSEIVITMKNIDAANNLFKFLKEVSNVASMGGDITLSYDGAEKESKIIGHDVRILNIKHVIYDEYIGGDYGRLGRE